MSGARQRQDIVSQTCLVSFALLALSSCPVAAGPASCWFLELRYPATQSSARSQQSMAQTRGPHSLYFGDVCASSSIITFFYMISRYERMTTAHLYGACLKVTSESTVPNPISRQQLIPSRYYVHSPLKACL